MSKKLKILLFLLAIAVFLFFYLLFTSESFKQEASDRTSDTVKKSTEAKEQITANYKISVAKIVNDYLRLETGSTTISQVESAKENLFNLKPVPAELRDLHLNLVMAFNKMEDYLAGKNNEAREESEKIINQAKSDYSWLIK